MYDRIQPSYRKHGSRHNHNYRGNASDFTNLIYLKHKFYDKHVYLVGFRKGVNKEIYKTSSPTLSRISKKRNQLV